MDGLGMLWNIPKPPSYSLAPASTLLYLPWCSGAVPAFVLRIQCLGRRDLCTDTIS